MIPRLLHRTYHGGLAVHANEVEHVRRRVSQRGRVGDVVVHVDVEVRFVEVLLLQRHFTGHDVEEPFDAVPTIVAMLWYLPPSLIGNPDFELLVLPTIPVVFIVIDVIDVTTFVYRHRFTFLFLLNAVAFIRLGGGRDARALSDGGAGYDGADLQRGSA